MPNREPPTSLPIVTAAIESPSIYAYHADHSTVVPRTTTHRVNPSLVQANPARASHHQSFDALTGTPDNTALVQADHSAMGDFTATTSAWMSETVSSGVFTVGPSGLVSLDYLYDGGAYEGELALFSLEGLETFQPGSRAFMREAARRALSDSHLGAVVIQDATDAARLSGAFPDDKDVNAGIYKGVKTVRMQPGTRFGFMLVPHGTVQEVFERPKRSGAKRPLFSLATANPNHAVQVGQIGNVTGAGHFLAFEDLRTDRRSDRDYNDVIIHIQGAIGRATPIDALIAPRRDWRTTPLGQQLLEYVTANTRLDPQQPLIGIIDTGFAAAHPDLNYHRITLGPDYLDGDGNPLLQPGDGHEHGTPILGMIAATRNNGLGIDGINDAAPIWISRAVGSGRWAEALIEFVEAAKASGQPNAVVNLSFDLTQINPDGSVTTRYELTPQERVAIEYARQHGVIIVAAAGNDGGVMSALGQASQEFDNIITVGSAHQMKRALYSSYGAGLDIVAPGGTASQPIVSTVGVSMGTMAGSSIAAAQVTGAISHVWAANPDLNYRQVIEILKRTAIDIGEFGWDAETGAGLLNMIGAVSLAKLVEPEPYTPLARIAPLTWSGAGYVTASERATDGENGFRSRVTYENGSYADIFYDRFGQPVGQDAYNAAGQLMYSERGHRGTYFHYMPDGKLVVLHVESFYYDEERLVIQPVEVIFVDDTPDDLSDNPRFRIVYTDDPTSHPEQVNLPTNIGTWDGVSFDFISKRLSFYFKDDQGHRHEVSIWYDERKAAWYDPATAQWQDITPPASTSTPNLPNAPQPGQGNVPETAGAFDKTVVSNGTTTHYYTNGYLSIQPNGQSTWYTVGTGVPVVIPPSNVPAPVDGPSGGGSSGGGAGGNAGSGSSGNPGSPSSPTGQDGSGGSPDGGTETNTVTEIRTTTGTPVAGSVRFFFSSNRTKTTPTDTDRELIQNQGNGSWSPDFYRQQARRFHDSFTSTQTVDGTDTYRRSHFSKGESQSQFEWYKSAGERHYEDGSWEKGTEAEISYSRDTLTGLSRHSQRTQGYTSHQYYRNRDGQELVNRTERMQRESSSDYTTEQSHYRDSSRTETRRQDQAQQQETEERVIEEFGRWTTNQTTKLANQLRTHVQTTINTDTEITIGTSEAIEESETILSKLSDAEQIKETEAFWGLRSTAGQTQTTYIGEQTGSGSSEYRQESRTRSQVTQVNGMQFDSTEIQTKTRERAERETLDGRGTLQKHQRFHSTTESEHNHVSDGTEQFRKTTASLSYAYRKTDAVDADSWSLQISRAQSQFGTDLDPESVMWSWTKLGWLSDVEADRWSEQLSYTRQGRQTQSGVGLITATPDAVGAQELKYSDELAAELLQLLEQTGESDGTDLSHHSYPEKLAAILDHASSLLDSELAAQLQAQIPDLLALGQVAQQWQCHGLLDPWVGGLFSEALAVQSSWDAKLFGIDFKWFVKAGTQQSSLPALLFPAKLIAAARSQPELAESLDDPAWVKALVELARAYAALNPMATASEPPLNFFLDTLWTSQDGAGLQKGAIELGKFLKGAGNSIQMMEYEQKLLMALNQFSALNGKLNDAAFIKSNVDLGALYLTLHSTDVVVADPSNFLLKIWEAENETDIKIAATHLQNFIADLTSKDSEKVYSLPSLQDESLHAAAIAIPIVVLDVLIVVSAVGITISLIGTNNNEAEEAFKIIVDTTTDTVADIGDRIIQLISQISGSASQALEGFRGLVEDVVQQNFFPINTGKLFGETTKLAQHLARYLRVSSVGGIPSGEPPDPSEDPENHWWREIKAFLKNIQTAIKGATRKQVLRELRKKFTDEQIEEIERALAEVAKRRGEPTPPFLPPPR
ncbi:S8 family serine peptidase [Leptolyngbya sp. NK1-12]|uniref:S8 family serine peptidase n=2 Tax=Leptolyngbya sp. NK1-12 TaxID=2547451 RepID=A0AA96WMQ8_9CYAN|nr:S8 family serine peptidase [Leptolyngbya sp. NK1-12]WNZ28029.1 S8 family serine peptidase [Leptolyngbya sp. NK1-12]